MQGNNSMVRRLPGYICLLVLLGGCAVNVQSAQLSMRKYPPRPGNYLIEVYQDVLPEAPFVEIAAVKARKRGINSAKKVIGALQERARMLGGDAIINLSESIESSTIFDVHRGERIVRLKFYSATVIRFIEP
ncbi:hypothetical protein ACFL3X_01865 [Gemmatimonadota bacterium]